MNKRFFAISVVALLLQSSGIAAETSIQHYYNYLKQTASEAMQFDRETAKDWYNRLPDLKIQENIEHSLGKLKEMLAQPPESYDDKNTHSNRMLIEKLGRTKISRDGKTLNEYAQDAINHVRPDLRDTDYFSDPARTLSYFILLDPKGFIENVRLIRGPLNTPMTLKEAYQYYSRTDPERAQKILNMLESLQMLYQSEPGPDQRELIIKSIQQTVDLLNSPEK